MLRFQTTAHHLVKSHERGALRARAGGVQTTGRAGGIGDFDEGEGQGMFEDTVLRGGGRLEQGGNRTLIADPSERLGGHPLHFGRAGGQHRQELRQRRRVFPDTHRMERHLANPVVPVGQGQADGFAGRGSIDSSQRPERVSPRFRRGRFREDSVQPALPNPFCGERKNRLQGRNSFVPLLGQFLNGALPNRGPVVAEELRQLAARRLRPGQLQPSRIDDLGGADTPDPVNRAQHIGLPELGSRATNFIPAPRIDHEQAAIGVFQHVRRMKVGIVRNQKIAVAAIERGAPRFEHMTGDLVQVEEAGEEVVLVFLPEHRRGVTRQTARRGRPELREHGHEVAGAWMVVENVVVLSVDTAIDGMDQAIALAAAGMLEERGGEDPLSAGSKRDFHRIIHPARHDRFQAGAVRSAAEDMRRAGDKRGFARAVEGLLSKGSLAPIDPAIGSQVGAVHVVRAAGQSLALEPFFALVRHAVAVGVRQFPNAGGSADIERAVEPHRPFREHHLVREHRALIEEPVAIGVLQAHDAMRFLRQLFIHLVVGARGIGHI